MRDIRGDLQERASLVERQINAAQNQFEKLLEQLKNEHDSRAIDLTANKQGHRDRVSVAWQRLEATLGEKTSPPSRPHWRLSFSSTGARPQRT